MPDATRARYENAQTVIEIVGGFAIVRAEAIVRENLEDFMDKVEVPLIDGGERHFVIDCRETRYIDSRGMGLLVLLNKKLRGVDGTLYVVGLNDDLRMLFSLVKLDTVLTLFTEGGWRAEGGCL
ncbi:MAG: STAS domain-containing protein [Gemmatimonadaceae bacterium]